MKYVRKMSLQSIWLLFIVGFFLLNCVFFLYIQQSPYDLYYSDSRNNIRNNHYPDPIDIVYTWVNGSDPRLLRELAHHKAHLYLDSNFRTQYNEEKVHCSFNPCAFDNHFMVSPRPTSLPRNRHSFLHAITNSLATKLNISTATIGLTFIKNVDRSIFSRNEGVLLQSSVSISNLFYNQSHFPLKLHEFYSSETFTISQIFIAAIDEQLGYPVENYAFISGLPEMRDGISEDKWRTEISKQLDNDTKIIKASATGFLIAFSPAVTVNTLNASLISKDAQISKSVLVVDINLVRIISGLSASRYQDNDELKYSLRSVEKFVDFFRYIYIVTDGQIPSWLNTDHPKIKIVFHSQIFANKSHLPTFNSAAIEMNLHNIPGLAPHFIYLNDDVFFGKKIYPEDFFSPSSGYKVYLGWSVPNCVESCPSSWLADGYCDHDCNVQECQWDAGDCVKTLGQPGIVNFGGVMSHNWTQGDYFRSILGGISSDFCSVGCNSKWLADRYCDQACNVDSCGFDLGDCGDTDLYKLPSVRIENDGEEFIIITNSSLGFVMNMQGIISAKDNVTEATIDDAKEIFSSSYAIKYRLLVILFKRPDSCKDCYSGYDQIITVNVTIPQQNNFTKHISKHLVLNCSKLCLYTTPSMVSPTIKPSKDYSIIDLVRPTESYKPLQLASHSESHNISIDKLEWDRPLEMSQYRLLLNDGLISVEGYQRLVYELWVSHNTYSKQNIRMTALSDDLRIEKMSWGFLPWEKDIKISANYSTGHVYEEDNLQSRISSMRHLLDLYAESLRYSNRIMSGVYSSSQRRVPAHGPHFISTDILRRSSQKFDQSWNNTSSHRFRSPNDLQFAFTYFYYLMSENMTVPVIDVLHSVDTDHSGTLDSNELRTLALRVSTSQNTSADLVGQLMSDIKSDCIVSQHPRFSGNLSSSSFNIRIPFLAFCLNWTHWQQPKSTLRHKFSTHEDTELTFIMISSNHQKVMHDLDGLRSTPKKFFCLNDNLVNSDFPDNVTDIRGYVKDFLNFMFPVASQFELVSSRTNHSRWGLKIPTIVVMVAISITVWFIMRKISVFLRNRVWSRRFSLRSLFCINYFDSILITI